MNRCLNKNFTFWEKYAKKLQTNVVSVIKSVVYKTSTIILSLDAVITAKSAAGSSVSIQKQ